MSEIVEIIKSNTDIIIPSGISIFIGYNSYDILSNFMLVGDEAISYYAEAHLSPWNSCIHTIVMPYSMYGMLFWLSSLFNLNPLYAKKMMWCLYTLFIGHYYRFNKMGTLLYCLLYFNTVRKASIEYKKNYTEIILKENISTNRYFNKVQYYLFVKGFFISFCGLLFQEIVGHWIGGDIASRPEAVPNAIVYAMYFSSGNLLSILN